MTDFKANMQASAQPNSETRSRMRMFLARQWKEWRWLICLIVFVIVPVKSSLADWNWVPTGSMNPTIIEGDMVFVQKVAYDLRVPLTLTRVAWWAEPTVGEIIVVFSPQDGIRLVKRVVGIPGDEVEIKDNVLIINGQPMNYTEQSAAIGKDLPPNFRMSAEFAEEDLNGTKHWVMYLPEFNVPHRNFPKQTIPEGKLFVIGDSRDNSHDSRYFGVVDRNMVVGRATSVIVSFDKSRKWKPRWHRFFTSLYK